MSVVAGVVWIETEPLPLPEVAIDRGAVVALVAMPTVAVAIAGGTILQRRQRFLRALLAGVVVVVILGGGLLPGSHPRQPGHRGQLK